MVPGNYGLVRQDQGRRPAVRMDGRRPHSCERVHGFKRSDHPDSCHLRHASRPGELHCYIPFPHRGEYSSVVRVEASFSGARLSLDLPIMRFRREKESINSERKLASARRLGQANYTIHVCVGRGELSRRQRALRSSLLRHQRRLVQRIRSLARS